MGYTHQWLFGPSIFLLCKNCHRLTFYILGMQKILTLIFTYYVS